MPSKNKKVLLLLVVAALLVTSVVTVIYSNTDLEVNSYIVKSDRLPKAFDGFRIAQVSDFHNAEMGKNNKKLLSALRKECPDIIAITGDLIDSRNTDIEVALSFLEEAVKIAPCCYVTGNHEARVYEYQSLKEELIKMGVSVLNDKQITLKRSGASISLVGIDDPSFNTDYLFDDEAVVADTKLKDLLVEKGCFTVLLSHRPELFEIYVENGIDLVLTGHAHGGQIRLPFVGGLVAPGQGLFPEYDSGLYSKNNTVMAVSRGIGNSIVPFRINNKPEVLLVILKTEN